MSEITQEQLRTLWHTLGLCTREPWKPSYRNYYCAPKGCVEMAELVTLGLMKSGKEVGQNIYFHATEKGKLVALRALPKFSRKETKAKQRYSRFLSFKDATGGNFREFLTYLKAEKEGAL